ncbi:MAG: hypothetical protein ABFC78_00390 [Methanoregula sp.]
MAKITKERLATRGTKNHVEQKKKPKYDDPWDEENPEQDPCRNVRDIYEDQSDSQNDDYIWPESEDEYED